MRKVQCAPSDRPALRDLDIARVPPRGVTAVSG